MMNPLSTKKTSTPTEPPWKNGTYQNVIDVVGTNAAAGERTAHRHDQGGVDREDRDRPNAVEMIDATCVRAHYDLPHQRERETPVVSERDP